MTSMHGQPPRTDQRRRPSALLLLAAVCAVLWATGCEPELGLPCGTAEDVNPGLPQREGFNNLARDLSYENCEEALCASTNGSRPYCTKQCEADAQCSDAPGFRCDVITTFGPLGCSDFEALGNTCYKSDGTLSDNLNKYCVTDKQTLEERDVEFGREIWEYDDGTEGEPDAEPDATPVDGGTP